jgi:hypothetical protein
MASAWQLICQAERGLQRLVQPRSIHMIFGEMESDTSSSYTPYTVPSTPVFGKSLLIRLWPRLRQ